MRAKRHAAESPWASFADALSGMLFVFVITTFYFSWQLARATQEKKAEIARITAAEEVAQALASDKPGSVTSCLTADHGDGERIDATPQASEARISLYLQGGVEWFPTSKATLGTSQAKAVDRVRYCIEQLLYRQANPADLLSHYDVRVFLEGHTDIVPVKGADQGGESNWELSARRAAAVLRHILDSSRRIQDASAREDLQLTAVGMAEQQPAWGRICREAASPGRDAEMVDDVDVRVCGELQRMGELRPDQIKAVFVLIPAAFALGANCKPVGDLSLAAMSGPDLLRAWANRCVKPPATAEQDYENRRLGMLRRVDLRFEIRTELAP